MSARLPTGLRARLREKRPARSLWTTACDPSAKPSTETGQLQAHGNVGGIERPDLVGALNRYIAQQIGVDRMRGVALARVPFAIQRLDPHPLHQRRDVLAAHLDALTTQQLLQQPRACKRVLQVQRIDPALERKIGSDTGRGM